MWDQVPAPQQRGASLGFNSRNPHHSPLGHTTTSSALLERQVRGPGKAWSGLRAARQSRPPSTHQGPCSHHLGLCFVPHLGRPFLFSAYSKFLIRHGPVHLRWGVRELHPARMQASCRLGPRLILSVPLALAAHADTHHVH